MLAVFHWRLENDKAQIDSAKLVSDFEKVKGLFIAMYHEGCE
jgi:hypothetical protein